MLTYFLIVYLQNQSSSLLTNLLAVFLLSKDAGLNSLQRICIIKILMIMFPLLLVPHPKKCCSIISNLGSILLKSFNRAYSGVLRKW